MSASLKPRPKACKFRPCGKLFTPSRSFVTWCSPDCGWEIARAKKEQAEQKARSEARKVDRETRDRLKSLRELRAEAQDVFNRYIRLRDAGKPCICCGKPLGDAQFGGAFDAGHYLSRGSAPHLAFDERNVNAQRKGCNRPGGTTRLQFRAGMIERWGIAVVEELEADQTERRYRHDDYRAIKAEYRRKARELEKKETA